MPWTATADWYDRRREGHPELWAWIECFIRAHDVRSMIEVGGGYGWAKRFVDLYLGIELNPRWGGWSFPDSEIINADFCKLDPQVVLSIFAQFDLLLAAAVVEHVEHYEVFLTKCLDCAPRWILISFFRGLDRDRNHFCRRASVDSNWSQAGGVYYDNFYARAPLEAWLDAHVGPGRYQFHQAGPDTILLISPCPSV